MMKNGYYDNSVFARNLKKLIEEKGITAKELSAHIGVAQSTVSEWLSAKKIPRMDKVEKMRRFFGCQTSDIIGYSTIQEEDPGTRDIMYAFNELSKANQHKLLAYAYELIEEENNRWRMTHNGIVDILKD